MPVEVINGRAVHVQTVGAGPDVVIVHGLLGSITSWYFAVAPVLAAENRVLMYDLRGHGLSEFSKSGYGMRSMAGDLAAVVDSHTDGTPLALVGHSYGAVIALRYALDHPDRVRRLVMVEPPLPVISATWIEGFRNRSSEGVMSSLPLLVQAALKARVKRPLKVGAKMVRLSTQSTIQDDMLAEPDIADAELATLQCPVLLCCGTRSNDVFRETSARLLQVIPNVRLQMIEGDHYLPEDSPRPLAQAIREFLAA